MGFFTWLQETALATWVQESTWGYPIVLSSHAVGMAIVAGTLIMVDLRILGFAPSLNISSFDRVFTVIWIGFFINFVSGLALFTADAVAFITTPVFLIKLACILVGGILAWALVKMLFGDDHSKSNIKISTQAKITAAISILLWTGAIIAGRLTAYLK